MLPCLGREWSGLWSGAGPLLGGNSGSDRRLLDSPALSDRLDRWEDRGRLLLILALRRSGISRNCIAALIASDTELGSPILTASPCCLL